MELKEFIADTQQNLDNFKKYWVMMHKDDPVNFPMHFSGVMSMETWLDMFETYLRDNN